MKFQECPSIAVHGHCKITDDLGNVHLDQSNAIHPQNMARVIARALANESNYNIYRIAYGNGGTTTDAAYTASYNPVNDGQPPDTRTWDSRLYNETYSEIIDEGNVILNTLLGTDPGTSDPNVGTRPGGGSVPASDPTSTLHTSGPGIRSIEEGVISQVIITSVLNPDEPTGQDAGSPDPMFAGSFAFDEIGLYTGGAAATSSAGVADLQVGNKTTEDDTGLLPNTLYGFRIDVDGGGFQNIEFTTPLTGSGTSGEILFGDLCEAINTGDATWNVAWNGNNPLPGTATVAITDPSIDFPSITGAETYGFLRFVSPTVGDGSSIVLEDAPITGSPTPLFASFATAGIILTPIDGEDAGVQNDPLLPETERERLLTHLVFSPVLKAEHRTLTVTYTLTISVARTPTSV